MADQQSQPSHDEDPRGQDTGDGGYPEVNPEGSSPTGDSRHERDRGADAPSTSSDKEDDRTASTGNPSAAG